MQAIKDSFFQTLSMSTLYQDFLSSTFTIPVYLLPIKKAAGIALSETTLVNFICQMAQ